MHEMYPEVSETLRIKLLKGAVDPSRNYFDESFDHKEFYAYYISLGWEGLTYWMMGTAFITDKGREYLREKVDENV